MREALYADGAGEGICGNSLYTPLHFAVNPKVPLIVAYSQNNSEHFRE